MLPGPNGEIVGGMPTKAEMEELVNKCTRTTVTRNGISGVEFTGPSGNSIFLPNGGSRKETTIESQGISSLPGPGLALRFCYSFAESSLLYGKWWL